MEQTKEIVPAHAETGLAKTSAERAFELEQRKAKALAASPLVPENYRNNLGSCLIALDMANRTGVPPLMVMQNLHIIQGRPSWSSAFLIACVNSSGRYTSLRYETRGTEGESGYAVRAVATEKATGEVLTGTWITAEMVENEGWSKKGGSKWKTMPEQMYRYRAAAFWVRSYAPEIAVGLTADEVQDMQPEARPVVIRWSPRQMEEAMAELRSGAMTIDEVEEAFPTLATDQVQQLREAAQMADEDGGTAAS